MPSGIGTGLYTPREISRLIGLSTGRVSRWARGYSFRSGDEVRKSSPVVIRETDPGLSLTFLDLVEIMFVKSFLDHGVKMRTIRRAAAIAVDQFGAHHPFALRRFETDGRTIFARVVDEERSREYMRDVIGGQSEFLAVVSVYLKQIDYGLAGQASRWWPLGKTAPVVVDPNVSFGTPVTATRHVPTFAIHGALSSGESVGRVAEWFGISIREVDAAERLEQRMAA